MLGAALLGGHSPPLHAGRERSAAPTRQPGVGDGVAHRRGAQFDGSCQRGVAPVAAVGVERRRVDDADVGQETQRRITLLGDAQLDDHLVGGHVIGCSDTLHEPGRRPLALTEARRPVHVATGGFDVGDQFLVAGDLTGRVDADMGDRPVVFGFVDAEHLVEGGDAVGLRRRDLQHVADAVEPAGADPPLGALEGVQRREQQMTPFVAARRTADDETLGFVDHGRVVADRGADRFDLDVVGQVGPDVEVSHRARASRCGWTRP